MLIHSSFITLALTCLAMVMLSMRRPGPQLAMHQVASVVQARRRD